MIDDATLFPLPESLETAQTRLAKARARFDRAMHEWDGIGDTSAELNAARRELCQIEREIYGRP